MMQIDALQAFLFALIAVPLSVLTFYVDMKHKKITNVTVWALFFVFVVIGLATLPITDFLWRFASYAIVFAYGFVIWMLRQMGAGDVKLMSVAALFVHPGDTAIVIFLLIAALFASTITVLITHRTPLTRLAPNWASWAEPNPDDPDSVGRGKKFTIPMGTGLSLTLSAYLVLGVLQGQ